LEEDIANQDCWHPLLREMSTLIGPTATLQFFQTYQGMRISIPAHLYDSALVAQRILQQAPHHNAQALATKYGYSRRWVNLTIQTAKGDDLK